ncbi:hypothetical protein [Streptomyces sp. NPDC005407]|uniref:hypothetical protein n=1 Tax=Streptomyces sp. NPDC005407 TaxID=3155340 RepID=UPI0033B135FD
MQFKTAASGVTSDEGKVVAVICKLGEIDKEGDIVRRGSVGTQRVVISDWNHSSHGENKPVGRGVIKEQGDELVFSGEFFLATDAGRDAFGTLKEAPELIAWSIGYDVLDSTTGGMTGARRILTRLKIREVSMCLISAGSSRTLSVKTSDSLNEIATRTKLRAIRDRLAKSMERSYSELASWAVPPGIRAAAELGVQATATRLGMDPNAIKIRYVSEEHDTGQRTKHGDKVDGDEFACYTHPVPVWGWADRTKNTVWIVAAGQSDDDVFITGGHEVVHLSGMDNHDACDQFAAIVQANYRNNEGS